VIGLVLIPYFRVNLEVVGLYERPWRRALTLVSALAASVSVLLVVYRVWPVLVPTVVVYLLLALPALPPCPAAVRRRLGRIPLADWLMSWFVAVAVVLTLIGVLFRGPSWTWVWPWA